MAKPIRPFSFPRGLAMALILCAASASCVAEAKASLGGKAGKAPATVNAFVVLPPDGEGAQLATRDICLPSAASLLGWTPYAVPSPGRVAFESDRTFGYEVIEEGRTGKDGEIQAFKLRVDGVAASGGTLCTVSFSLADLRPGDDGAFLQPATFAAVQAALRSKRRSGQVRVLAAKYQDGTFTFRLAVK